MRITETQSAIVGIFARVHPYPVSVADLEFVIGLASSTVRRHLRALSDQIGLQPWGDPSLEQYRSEFPPSSIWTDGPTPQPL